MILYQTLVLTVSKVDVVSVSAQQIDSLYMSALFHEGFRDGAESLDNSG